MIAILSLKRYRELLDKEKDLEGRDQMWGHWSSIPDLDIHAELHGLNAEVCNAFARCETGSHVASILHEAKSHCARLLRTINVGIVQPAQRER